MKTTSVLIYLFLLCILTSFTARAQNEPVPSSVGSSEPRKAAKGESSNELLSQFSLGSAVGTDAYSVPKAAIKTYKFTALIGKGEWDFNLYNSVPALSINSADSEQYLRNDLVKQLGGVINVSLGRTGYFANGKNPDMEDIKGARFEFRLGAKALDVVVGESKDRQLIPVLQSTLDFRYMIPLFQYEKNADKSTRTADQAKGNLSFRAIGALMSVMNSEVFDDYYSNRKGIPPNPTFFAGNFEINFYITNQLFINLGYALASEETIEPLPYFGISYGKSTP